jgi:16S rRNA (guanine966-N2)-methyltransferase
MRVLSGKLRGRKIKAAKGRQTRPTADKVKGAIFNVLRDKVEGARVLDLFSGTGNLAIEAISRGAARAVIVEATRQGYQIIAENLKSMGIEDCVAIFQMDAFVYLAHHREDKYDLIFLDPPYKQGLVDKALLMLAQTCPLSERGVIIVETGCNEEINPTEKYCVRQKGKYGDTQIWYLQRSDLK